MVDLILDTSVFASHDRGLGWIWNDLTMCFNSPPAAANIDNNCFYAELDANQPVGETVKINVPAQFPIQVFGQSLHCGSARGRVLPVRRCCSRQ